MCLNKTRTQCLLDWNKVDNVFRERVSIFIVSVCIYKCCLMIGIAVRERQEQHWLTIAEQSGGKVMQSGVCRSGMKWVEHAATPGPCLKSRLAEQQKIKPLKFKTLCMTTCNLCGHCCTVFLSASLVFYYHLYILYGGNTKAVLAFFSGTQSLLLWCICLSPEQ